MFISILVKALAATYLIWMGIQGLKEPDVPLSVDEKLDGQGFLNSLTSSMALTASNPLVIVFYAGIFPTLLDTTAMAMQDVITIISVIVIVEAGLAAAYCLPFGLFRYKISPTVLRKMQFVSSIVIILIGLYIGYSALPAEDLRSVF